MESNNVLDFITSFKEFIHFSYHFPFKVETLKLEYRNKELKITAQASKFRTAKDSENYLEVLKTLANKRILYKEVENENFSFEYSREALLQELEEQKEPLIKWFKDFLYQFTFIKSTRLVFSGSCSRPYFAVINGNHAISTMEGSPRKEDLAQFFLEEDIKESEFLLIDELLDKELTALKSIPNSSFLFNHIRGMNYSRSEYEVSLKK